MATIVKVRPILLSVPYGDADSLEVRAHLPSGYRTCGVVEATLDDGTTGLGEGYLAVFAPKVFTALVELMAPVLVGRSIFDVTRVYNDLCVVTGYWSMQGAARHAVSAIEIALQDCRAKLLGVPLYEVLGGALAETLGLYGSGGDAAGPEQMEKEFEQLERLGIDVLKIRARKAHVQKAGYCVGVGAKKGIGIAVDMTQNLANPPQSVIDAVRFVEAVKARSGRDLSFLEEPLAPADVRSFRALRSKISTKVAGGESITTARELCQRVAEGTYDIVQPDASVCGGIGSVLDVFTTARHCGCEVVVHCWGGPVGMMANYQAAIAGGGTLAEWPLPCYPLRDDMMVEPWCIQGGRLTLPRVPGLGVHLPKAIEARYPFREDAVYACLVDHQAVASDETWAPRA